MNYNCCCYYYHCHYHHHHHHHQCCCHHHQWCHCSHHCQHHCSSIGNGSGNSSSSKILNDQFVSVFTQEDSTVIPFKSKSPYPDLSHITITNNGVTKLLSPLNPHKTSGPDSIPARPLNEIAHQLAPALTLLFQNSTDQGTLHNDWKHPFITPIFKKGERSKASNYQSISLTSIVCKCLEHILHSNIIAHLESLGILHDAQHGSRKRRSCESQLILIINNLAKGIEEGQHNDDILLDFSKAFHKFPHQRLLEKLCIYGINGHVRKWIEGFLVNHSQQVLINGQSSHSSPVISGVPQRTVLCPLLFLVCINDLPECVTSTAHLFADDCFLSSAKDVAKLQKDLTYLHKWEDDWLMSFNPDKFEVIRVTYKKKTYPATYSICGHELKQVTSSKYLGIDIDSKLMWKGYINCITKKANGNKAYQLLSM